MAEEITKEGEPNNEAIVETVREAGSESEVQLAMGEYFREVLEDVFEQKREFFLSAIREKLAGMSVRSPEADSEDDGAEWTPIGSLSRLRSVVGGRFQNLKSRWVAAGFPLREHRGDKGGEYEVDEEGWLELSTWIAGQGFEARIASNDSKHLFEVRKRE
jgi:hypothetical protein